MNRYCVSKSDLSLLLHFHVLRFMLWWFWLWHPTVSLQNSHDGWWNVGLLYTHTHAKWNKSCQNNEQNVTLKCKWSEDNFGPIRGDVSLPGVGWRSGHAVGEAPSSPGSAQTRWLAVRAAAAAEQCRTVAWCAGSTSQNLPTPWGTSTPTHTRDITRRHAIKYVSSK